MDLGRLTCFKNTSEAGPLCQKWMYDGPYKAVQSENYSKEIGKKYPELFSVRRELFKRIFGSSNQKIIRSGSTGIRCS